MQDSTGNMAKVNRKNRTQLGPDRRWRALLLHAMRAYGPFPDAEPPLIGDQFTLSMAFPDTG